MAAEIAIVGAGVAGLSAAGELAARGRSAVVFDKGRSPGGRSSSRRASPYAFDHGAQYFTARDPAFRRAVAEWIDAGAAAVWPGPIVSLSGGATEPARGGAERLVGTPSMSAVAKRMAAGLDVHTGVRVASIARHRGRWRLGAADGADLGEFDALIVTAPPEQARALLAGASPVAERLGELRMLPCWAALLGLEARYEVPFDGAFCAGSALSWVARDSSKPGRPDHEAWVLHASPEWSEANLDAAREEVPGRLVGELERLTGVPLGVTVHADAHLWRFARPADTEGLADGLLADPERRLVLAGDGYCGGRIEGAWSSGAAAARRLFG